MNYSTNICDYCVYAHINKVNQKIYIGITSNRQKRWRASSYTECPYFSKAIQKYGWDNFDHIIIIDQVPKQVAEECEKYLIKKYNTTDRNKGYNISAGGSGGRTSYGASHPLSKPVYQYDLDGNYIMEWENCSRPAEYYGIQSSKIGCVARGEIRQIGGFQWKYEKHEKIDPYPGHWGLYKKQYPKVYKVDFFGNLINIYDDLHVIDNYSKRQIEVIRSCCNKTKLSFDNHFWLFEDDYNETNINYLIDRRNNYQKNKPSKRICVYDLNGNLLQICKSKAEASEIFNIKEGTIQHTCEGYNYMHKSGNYMFYYYEDTNGNNIGKYEIIDD